MRCTYLLIPCDDSTPVRELTIDAEQDKGDADLKSHLTTHFSEGTVDPKAVEKQLGGLSNAMDLSVLEQGTVETFPLTRPSASNGMSSVNFYLDECGVLKNQPRNARASQLAVECGHNAPFHGDIFVAREVTGASGRNLVDFRMEDMSSSAAWMKSAAQANYEHHLATKKMHDQMGDSFQHVNLSDHGDNLTGGSFDNYSWTQSTEEVEVRVPIPATMKARDVDVVFNVRKLRAGLKGQAPLLDGELGGSVRPDECTWSIAGSGAERHLLISMEKQTEGRWTACLEGETNATGASDAES